MSQSNLKSAYSSTNTHNHNQYQQNRHTSSSTTNNNNTSLFKYLTTQQSRIKYRKQCLKSKNILFQNDSLQIGCKISSFYDFYSSKNYLQLQIFIGNKTNRKLQGFRISYRGSDNLQLYLQQKNPKFIPENTQFKQKSILMCNNYQQPVFMLLDFQSQILTLKSLAIPITLYSFLAVVPQNLSTLPLTSSYAQLSDILNSKYQYLQQSQVTCDPIIFRKGLIKQLGKYFNNFTQHADNLFVASFTLSDLNEQYVLALVISGDIRVKLVLAGNQYQWFDAIINNIKYLLSQ